MEAPPKLGNRCLTREKVAVIQRLLAWGADREAIAKVFVIDPRLVDRIQGGRGYRTRICEGCESPVPLSFLTPYCDQCKNQVCAGCGGYKSSFRKSRRCASCDRERVAKTVRLHQGVCRDCGVTKPDSRKDPLCADCRDASDTYYKRKRATYEIPCARCGADLPRTKHWTRNLCLACANRHDRIRKNLRRRICTAQGCENELDHHRHTALCLKCYKKQDKERKLFQKTGIEVLTPEKYAEIEEKRLNRFRNGRSVEIPLESLKKGNFVREKQPKDEKGRFLSKNGQSTAQT